MKKWMKKIMAGAVVVSSSIGLAGCGIFQDSPNKESYVVKGYNDTYYVNDIFSILGTTLRITNKQGETEEVSVTEDMIKQMPDMTTAGEKTVVIEYNGVEYSFTITIENRTNEQLMEKLRSFLRRYESNKDSLIEAKIITNLQAKYLDEVVNVNEQEAVKIFSQMFDNDKLLDTSYNALFDAIVQGSFDLDESYIVNSNELKAKLDTLKVLKDAKETMSNFDMRTYLIDLALPRTDVYYIDTISNYINEICEIDSIRGKVEINDMISTYYYKLKRFEKFDVADVYTELLNKINIYSVNPVIKEATSTLNTKDPEAILHIFSGMIEKQWLNYGHVMDKDVYAEYEMLGLEHPAMINTTLAKNLIREKAKAERLITYNVENIIKDLINCESVDALKDIVLSSLDAYYNYANTMIDIVNIQKENNIVLVIENYGYYEVNISGKLMWNPDITSEPPAIFKPYYDDEIEYYTAGRDNAKKYYEDIKNYDIIEVIKRNSLVEELFEAFEYPEENKQEAIDNIYAILNSELEGEDLYWAIADVIVPNSANENIEKVKDIVKSYLDNGWIEAIKEHKLVEELFENFEYPEENKQEAIDNIYAILNSELEGEDLYWAIADVLFPNGANEHFEEIKDIVKSYLDNGLAHAVEEYELVEKLIDFVGNYPEEYKQQAIDTVYSMLKEERTGKDLYLDILNVLTPKENDYYIDYACEFINEHLSIETVSGQDEIKEIITKYFEKIKTATKFDIKDAYSEILTAINIHSTNDVVKVATGDLKSLDIEQMRHIISDIIYTQNLETIQIASTGIDGYVEDDYQIIESKQTLNLINKYASNQRNGVRAYEDAVWNLINTTSIENLFNIAQDYVKAQENYYLEEIAIVEMLEENKWCLGKEYTYESFDGYQYIYQTNFSEVYYLEKESVWNEDEWGWQYVWVGYNKQLGWLNESKQEFVNTYSHLDVIKSLIFEPKEAVNKLIEDYKQEIVECALKICYNYLEVERDGYMASDLEELFTDSINDYLNNEFDREKLLTNVEEIIKVYATDDTKTMLNVGYILYNALNYDESVDYNELFKDIELPKQVESIDYNKLMSQVMNKDAYEIFNLNDIEIEYIQDENGKIVAEKLTLKVDVSFDVIISSLQGEIEFTLTLDFNPEI